MEYVEVVGLEQAGGCAPIGIKVLLAIDRKLTANDKIAVRRAVDEILEKVQVETVSLNPDTAVKKKKLRDEIVALFPQSPVYVEEIENQYCNLHCCVDRPWFVVTTAIGRVKIGWRKRVLSIQWQGSEVRASAEQLFPNENTTRIECEIHAWSYEKAKEYLITLLKDGPEITKQINYAEMH